MAFFCSTNQRERVHNKKRLDKSFDLTKRANCFLMRSFCLYFFSNALCAAVVTATVEGLALQKEKVRFIFAV
jgi:hypothetical protein